MATPLPGGRVNLRGGETTRRIACVNLALSRVHVALRCAKFDAPALLARCQRCHEVAWAAKLVSLAQLRICGDCFGLGDPETRSRLSHGIGVNWHGNRVAQAPERLVTVAPRGGINHCSRSAAPVWTNVLLHLCRNSAHLRTSLIADLFRTVGDASPLPRHRYDSRGSAGALAGRLGAHWL